MDGGVVCKCNWMAAERTVGKEGKTKGKKFWACPKPKDESCGFFQWLDGQGMVTKKPLSPKRKAEDSGSESDHSRESKKPNLEEQRNREFSIYLLKEKLENNHEILLEISETLKSIQESLRKV
jgi:hypothetical protein